MSEAITDRLYHLNRRIISCRRCPRLVQWRQKVAREKVARYAQWTYWGKPVPGFGDPGARLLVVGLAPAAHGANRTGRMFTGDRSGDWLYSTLYKFNFSSAGHSESADDGLTLKDCYISAIIRCAPPGNKPLKEEIEHCREYLNRELIILRRIRVIIALGRLAFDETLVSFSRLNPVQYHRKPKFSHGAEYQLSERLMILASYHPSQQNTFTGRLTRQMFEEVFGRARRLLDSQ